MAPRQQIYSKRSTAEEVAQLARLARLLDAVVRVPGTPYKIGFDSLIGFIPGVGDIIGGIFSGYIVMRAARIGIPPFTIFRMLINVVIDVFGGLVPGIGDLFDIAWDANVKNVDLLERVLENEVLYPRSRAESKTLFMIIIGLFLLGILGAAVFVTILLFRFLGSIF